MHRNGELKRNAFGGLDCDELLKTLDFVTVTYLHSAASSPLISKGCELGGTLANCIKFPKGSHWLWLCSSKLQWAPGVIQLRHNGYAVPVTLGADLRGRVHFPQRLCRESSDLDDTGIDSLLTQLGRPAEVADEMLERVKGNFTNSFDDFDGFIDAAIVLMFAVQPGRTCSTCATSLMLLELLAGKHLPAEPHERPLTLGDALRLGSPKRSTAAIRKELSILRHWLDATELRVDYNQLSVKGRILKLLRTYLG